MKKILFLISLVSLLTACGGTATTTTTTSSTAVAAQTITLQDFTFSPKAVTVKVGDSVTWTNADSASHTVTSEAFDSGTLATGQSFSYTFDKAGTFDFHCSIHPTMTGTINVQ